jgi:ATP-dependent Clp protease ATP-binding subunit ClpC
MLLDDNGLNLSIFDPVLASVLGNARGEEGCKVLAEAIAHGRASVQLRDWLYCLARAPGTRLRRRLIDAPGKRPETFVDNIEAAMDDEPPGLPPDRLTARTVAPAVLRMLEAAERLAAGSPRHKVDDAVLTLALLEAADDHLREQITLRASEEGLKRFTAELRRDIGGGEDDDRILFGPDGTLLPQAFAPSGRRLLGRLAEDAASMGAKKVTTRHLLYTLLGNEGGLLTAALAVRGLDVKKDLHAALSRELARPGAKRNEGFTLGRDTLFDAVVAVLREARAEARRRGAQRIAEPDVCRAFVSRQPAELTRLTPGERLDLAGLRDYLEGADPPEEEEPTARRFTPREIEQNVKKRICGQDSAVDRVMPWVKRLRFGLPRDDRPAAVLLFLGPTGSGKTQLAKELARYVFGNEEQMLFLEMGQFKAKESMSTFVGAPPGYVGYGEGQLTNGLRDKPECVVLFDEVEKANPQVFDTLLRFADEGKISDPAGPVRDGRKCIIVMTTNAGQTWLRAHLEANPDARTNPGALARPMFEAAMRELELLGFRPEFLGRVDERVIFLPFTVPTCRRIVDGVLDRELEKFKKLKGVTLDVQDPVRDFLGKKTHERSRDEGARAAPRTINEHIVTPAIDLLTEGEDEGPARLIASLRGVDRVILEKAGGS